MAIMIQKINFSFSCSFFHNISTFTRSLSTNVFKNNLNIQKSIQYIRFKPYKQTLIEFLSLNLPSKLNSKKNQILSFSHPIYNSTKYEIPKEKYEEIKNSFKDYSRKYSVDIDYIWDLAQKNLILSGSWNFLIPSQYIDVIWERLISIYHQQKTLPIILMEVSSPNENNMHCISIYNENIFNHSDINEIVRFLKILSIPPPFYYQPQIYKIIGIDSVNPYGINCWLYSILSFPSSSSTSIKSNNYEGIIDPLTMSHINESRPDLPNKTSYSNYHFQVNQSNIHKKKVPDPFDLYVHNRYD